MSSNLPPGVTDKMIDDHFGAEVEPIPTEFHYPEGCSAEFSLMSVEAFIVDCKKYGGCTKEEATDLFNHIENIRKGLRHGQARRVGS